jgi:hypothetical protein
VEVTFDIDANGILNVTAKDRATNNEQKITITSSSGLSKDEIDKMAKDAESHVADDRKRKDEIDARNRADSMVYNIEKMLKEHGSKIAESDRKTVEEALELGCSDVGAVRYLLSISGQEQQPPAAPPYIGALNRYDRPQPSLEDYDRLRPNWVATEVIQ